MSTDTEHVEEGTEASLIETWEEWYHVPVLGAVMLFMFWVRTQAYDRFVTDDGSPALAAVDSWYHWRTVQWTAENYPYTMPYDVWTGFPDGRYVGQFGTLFDQLIVTAAMIVGLGDPSTETLYTVSLLAVPVMAALVAIPVFYMGRRLGGTIGGIVSVVVLALAPGTFLYRSTVGQLQHHVAEVLFMAIAVLAMMVALRVAEQKRPIYELLVDGDWDTLQKPALYSVLAGFALTLYIWVWPPGVVLIGIFGAFFAVQLCIDYVRGVSPDHVAFVGAVSLGLTAISTAILIEEPGTSVTSFGYLQPVSAALVAIGCVFMAWFARQWDGLDVDRRYYPGAIAGLIFVAFGAMAIVLPDFFSTFVSNLQGRVLPIGERGADLTIAEAQPPPNYPQHVFDEFGAAFYTMVVGLLFLGARSVIGREHRAEYTLIAVWTLFLISMSMTQIRFAYYLVLAVAVVNAVFIADGIRLLNVSGSVHSIRNLETYQIIALVMVVMLLFAPLLPPIAAGNTAWDRAEMTGPSGDAMTWEEANEWLQGNTPEPGAWGGADNASELEYYGVYEYPEDGNYEYPVGAYGVMSWWDYGHLVTVQGERIPHSNPFQQNARPSSAFLTAQDEARAELILDAIAAGESPTDESTAELESIVADADDSHEEIRYVMIDHEMAGGKFNAITQWTGPEYDSYIEQRPYVIQGQEQPLWVSSDDYYDTTLASLYLDDATGMEHYRLVHENDDYAIVGAMAEPGTQIPRPQYSLALREYGLESTWGNETMYWQQQLAQAEANGDIYQELGTPIWQGEVVSTVKTFERVEGATLTGSLEDLEGDVDLEGAAVTARAQFETEPGRTFVYEQDGVVEDGTFELTVSYATNDELGPEDGYTASSVEAPEPYAVIVTTEDGEQYVAEIEVPETAVVDGETVDVDDFTSIDELVSPPEETIDEAEDEDEVADEADGDVDDTDEDAAADETDEDEADDDTAEDDETDDTASITSPGVVLAG
ncbi:oligosaccharyl transferase, archaeosortase A system-associated [Natronobeatus ordinarius]|uniref:oligosaccharyl transferase, archaeosortase A system-associated n=1 Tax=Natronobeatus ordinarius TaxID=2963433 RepID=UPI0020CEAF3E|nr:oligosaccharyl transferase, archaeosortase A system-associated [Natronobeatus ordinarius]